MTVPQSPPTTTWDPKSETLSMKVRRICCLNNLGMTPLTRLKQLYNENAVPFLWHHNSPKRKAENERVSSQIGRPEVPKEQEEINCKWHSFFFFFLYTKLKEASFKSVLS